jgi:hypothetical protein
MTDKQLRINGEPVEGAKEFVWDGCHKIYLIFSAEDRKEMSGCGYDLGDLHDVSELPEIWERCCGLRFIHRADLSGPDIVPQQFLNEDGSEPEPVKVTYE